MKQNTAIYIVIAVLLSCITGIGWGQTSNPPTIEEIRNGRPWIPETTILVPDARNGGYRLQDYINYEFVNDEKLIGTWKAVDFVREFDQFTPGTKFWRGGQLMWDTIEFYDDGTSDSVYSWTQGHMIHSGSVTDSVYEIKEIDGEYYMFVQHKSGDYSLRYSKPAYYVFQKR